MNNEIDYQSLLNYIERNDLPCIQCQGQYLSDPQYNGNCCTKCLKAMNALDRSGHLKKIKGGGAFIFVDDKVILLQSALEKRFGKWELPYGGTSDFTFGTYHDFIYKEIIEEVGIKKNRNFYSWIRRNAIVLRNNIQLQYLFKVRNFDVEKYREAMKKKRIEVNYRITPYTEMMNIKLVKLKDLNRYDIHVRDLILFNKYMGYLTDFASDRTLPSYDMKKN